MRSWPRAAVAMPSSLTSTVSRSCVGWLKMLNRSSRLTGSVVRLTGTVGATAPSDLNGGLLALPGSHST